jgi:hypothetical protein
MKTDDHTFWDEMGVSWRASIPDAGLFSSRLEARLKRQNALLTAITLVTAAVSLSGFLLAAWTLWVGWSSHAWNFLARGVTLAVMSLLAAMATASARRSNGTETGSLRGMLSASIARTKRLIRVAELGCYAVAIVALGGTIGYALRVRLGRPPAVSPIEDLLILAIAGLALLWYRRSQVQALRSYAHLHHSVSPETEPQ